MSKKRAPLLAILLAGVSAAAARAADWPAWRGPSRDGKVEGLSAPASWPKELPQEWKVEVGEGHASPVSAGGRVYLLSREGEDEVVWCFDPERGLDPKSGRAVWRVSYPAPYEVNSAAIAHGKGPKATPAVSGGRVYTLGISGILSCFDAADGSVKWRKSFDKEFPATSPLYGTASSPLIEGRLCIAQVGGHDRGVLRAFDAETGDVKWSLGDDGPGYASAIAVDLGGIRQVVTQTQRRLLGASLENGKLLWSLPIRTPYDQNSVTPAVYRDLLIYSGLDQGTAAVRLAKKGEALEPREAWRSTGLSMYMSSPVVADGFLFGFSNKQRGQLYCQEAESGKELWKSEPGLGENAALINAGFAIVALTTKSQLIFFKAGRQGYEPLARYQAAPSPTWAHPLFLEERILIKDKTSLISLRWKN